MTREEAISILNHNASAYLYGTKWSEALEIAIKALEQEPCEDAVSRQAVLDAINTYDKFGYTETGCFVREPKGDYVPYIHYDDVIKCIKNAPPVIPKEKTGRWRHYEGMLICLECGAEFYDDIMEYCGDDVPKCCPNCGRKMIEPQESEVRNEDSN